MATRLATPTSLGLSWPLTNRHQTWEWLATYFHPPERIHPNWRWPPRAEWQQNDLREVPGWWCLMPPTYNFPMNFSRVQGHAGNKIIFIIFIIIMTTGVQWVRATLSNLYHLNTIPRHGICTSTSAIPHGATAMLQPLVWPAVSPTCIVSTNQWWRESSQWTLKP